MKVWIYGKDKQDIKRIKDQLDLSVDTIIGTSEKSKPGAFFPDAGLTEPLCAAMRYEIGTLRISDAALARDNEDRHRKWKELFEQYSVSVVYA